MIRVLYIHHAGVFGGASRSLLELIKAFPSGKVKPYVIVPPGRVNEIFVESGVETITTAGVSQFDNTRYSYYRGLKWFILLRELFFLPYTILAFIKALKKIGAENIDVIHVNEITNIPSVLLASFFFKKPIVLHVRSLQRDPDGLRNRVIYRLVRKLVKSVVAIDYTVANSLPEDLQVNVVHNGFSTSSKLSNTVDPTAKAIAGFDGKLKVVMVGSLLYMKGVVEFVQAAKLAKAANLNIDFIFVGDKPDNRSSWFKLLLKIFKFSHDAKDFILDYIQEHSLKEHVHILPFTTNIAEVYAMCDVACFPSHLNAVGRPVFEAALLKRPSIVAITNPFPDTIIDNETGICISAFNVQQLFDAIRYFYDNQEEVVRMGQNAFNNASTNFDIKRNALVVLDIYKERIISE